MHDSASQWIFTLIQMKKYRRKQRKDLIITSEHNGTGIKIPVLLGLFLGLRRGEIFGLTWDKIDFEKNSIIIDCQLIKRNMGLTLQKTQSSIRTLPLNDFLINALKEHRNMQISFPLNLVISNDDGGFCCPNYSYTMKQNEL